jgi:hypothetical protein
LLLGLQGGGNKSGIPQVLGGVGFEIEDEFVFGVGAERKAENPGKKKPAPQGAAQVIKRQDAGGSGTDIGMR